MAIALVLLTSLMLLAVDFVVGVFPDPDAQEMRLRTVYAESLAAQAAALLQKGDIKTLAATLDRAREDDRRIRSAAVRNAKGELLVRSGEHEDYWDDEKGEVSTLTQLYVPLALGDDRWGSVEIAYRPDRRGWLVRALAHPRMVTLACVGLLGLLVYWMYLRRALVHLDPSAVIPDRVRMAFDIMTEGVVVLDRGGRILLANRAFRTLSSGEAGELVGRRLSEIAWLAAGLTADTAKHPWVRAMGNATPVMDYAVEGSPAQGAHRKLVLNCAPIADQHGTVRGCIATFNDLTALHLANERLSEALGELHASRDEIQQKSIELEHMARHDALTGCLNRRAFFERMALAWEDARINRMPLSCLALDVDQFKSVNDRFGHPAGDRVIKQVGDTLMRTLRGTDIIGRYGGDEFLVAMPGCDLDTALALGEKLRRAVEERCGITTGDIGRLSVTVSIGVAALGEAHASVSDLVDEADQALYAAKADGRNRVSAAQFGGSTTQVRETQPAS
jgi:diguanylate cyclase (GGDEF)-like protein/PAS domain S-box-containing protein